MKTHPITVRLELEEQFLSDVLCTFYEDVEGWSIVHNAQTAAIDEGAFGYSLIKLDIEENDEDHIRKMIDLTDLAKAIERVLEPGFTLNSEIRQSIYHGALENDAGCIDVIAADVLVQIALLGEIRYS